jgi:hypothetical protein
MGALPCNGRPGDSPSVAMVLGLGEVDLDLAALKGAGQWDFAELGQHRATSGLKWRYACDILTTLSALRRRAEPSALGGNMRQRLFLALGAVFLLLGFSSPALADRDYGIAREFAADYDSQVTRTEGAVTCVGTGTGFVFNDLWQGTENDRGWIEVGTSYCDPGDPNAKWVWAWNSPSSGYYESVLQRNVPLGTTHTFKIHNHYRRRWRVSIDGATRANVDHYVPGGTGNSADVGLEVLNRMNSTQAYQLETGLRAWTSRASSQYWSGRDDCVDTDADIYPKWLGDTYWRHTLNNPMSESAC